MSAPAAADDHPSRVEAAALCLAGHGIAVFPVRVRIVADDQGKPRKDVTPVADWRNASSTEPDTIRRWFGRLGRWHGASLAIDTGKSGLVVIDPDGADGIAAWRAQVAEHSIAETYRVATPGGGEHWYYRADPDHPVRNDQDGKIAPNVDVRGIGGFVFAPPSRDTRGAYRWLEGEPEWPELPTTPALVIDRMAPRRPPRVLAPAGPVAAPTVSGVAFPVNYVRRMFTEVIAELEATRSGRNGALNRAAHRLGQFVGAGVLAEPEVRAALEAASDRNGYTAKDGDRARDATLSSGLESGIAEPATPPPARLRPVPTPHPDDSRSWEDGNAAAAGDAEWEAMRVTGWERTDLGPFLDGTYQPPQPGILHRTDGPGLFYPGLLHQVIGQPESGKTWLALLAVAARLAVGELVIYLDYESDPAQVVKRLLALGVDREAMVKWFDYRRPETGVEATNGEFTKLLSTRPVLVVIDGVTDALGLEGASMIDNDEVGKWIRQIPERIARKTGAAVVLIDHVAKGGSGGPSRYAVGAQQKLGKIRGVSYYVEPTIPVTPGQIGELDVIGTKDTAGQIKRHGVPRPNGRLWSAARVVIDATDPDHLEVRIAPPFGGSGAGATADVGERGEAYERIPVLMERMSRVLETAAAEISSTQAVKATKPFGGGRKEVLLLALQALVREGYATRRASGVSQLHGSITPFREGSDPGPRVLAGATVQVADDDPVIDGMAREVAL